MLSLVTVCFNNPVELEKTVASVRLQTKKPDHYVVVDSSDKKVQRQMREIAGSANATYVWVPPKGVYAAMRESMKHVPDESWVWWVNSSDWLAGRKSIEIVTDTISQAEIAPDEHWIVGELLRVNHPTPSVHPIGSTGQGFLERLRTGETGFPHPSTIFRKASLEKVSPYGDRLSIASDYATALRFGKDFGRPLLVAESLAVHDPTGLTFRHPIRNLWERSKARAANGPPGAGVAELWRLPRSALRGLFIKLKGEKPVQRDSDRNHHFPLRGNEPFEVATKPDCGLNFTA